MGPQEIAIGVAFAVSGAAPSYAFFLMSDPHRDFVRAKGLFCIGAISLAAVGPMWATTTDQPFYVRAIVCGIIGALALVALNESLRMVIHRERAATVQSAMRQTNEQESAEKVNQLLSTVHPETRPFLEQMASGARPAHIPDNLWRPLEMSGIFERDFTGPKGIVSGYIEPVRDWLKRHPANVTKPWKRTLEDLYSLDFSDLSGPQRNLEWKVSDPKIGLELTTVPITFRVRLDFRSGTDFVSIFVHHVDDVRVSDKIFDLIKSLREEIRSTRNDLSKKIPSGIQYPGRPYEDSKNLKFSGRVFIYTDQSFTVIELGELASWYHADGLSLEIRGTAYWLANRDR